MALDKYNSNILWRDVIKKEMKVIDIAFKFLNDNKKIIPSYSKITCHFVFDIKFDLYYKARYVASDHLALKVSQFLTYSSIVSQESVRITFTIMALNDLDIIMGDVSHAYLHTKTKEKVWFQAGPEFSSKARKQVLVIRTLYILPRSSNTWRTQLADTLQNHLGYKSTLTDPDI